MTIINTNQPCEIGERMDTLRDVETPWKREKAVLVVLSAATRPEWDAEWIGITPQFPDGYFYRASID